MFLCSPLVVYAVHSLSMQSTRCLCSPLVVYAVHSLPMQPLFAYADHSLIHVSVQSIPCLYSPHLAYNNNDNNNHNRELIERFRKSKRFTTERKTYNAQISIIIQINNCTTSVQNIRKLTKNLIQRMAKTLIHQIAHIHARARAHTHTHTHTHTHNHYTKHKNKNVS